MTLVKEKIMTLVETMPMQEAEKLFSYIIANYRLNSISDKWDSISEVEPDEIDLQMLSEIESDSECYDFS